MSAADAPDSSGPQPTADGSTTSRRGFLERIGVTAGTLVTIGAGGSKVAPRFSPVGRAQAVHPAVAVGAAYVSYKATKWLVEEITADEADSPAEGLTASALKEQTYTTIKTRRSNNRSTFIDNKNILDGVEHAGYAEGKIAGIEELNNQSTQSAVLDATQAAFGDYAATVEKNFLKSWNESVNELNNLLETVKSHPNVSPSGLFEGSITDDPYGQYTFPTTSVTLQDGSSFDLKEIHYESGESLTLSWSPVSGKDDPASWDRQTIKFSSDPGTIEYMDYFAWNDVWSQMQTLMSNVSDGLSLWVDNVYSQVQAGELDTSDLFTPRELAEMTAEEEHVNQAIADLMALNIPTDLEREATITLEQDNGTITLTGQLAPTSPPDGGMPAGETYDPSTLSYDVYFNYDISQGSGEWKAYTEAVDGGVVTFTSEPHAETDYGITTAAGETVTVSGSEFSGNDSDGDGTVDEWTVDLSSELETAITTIESVEMAANTNETQYELVRLTDPFTIETYTDSEGNEHDNANFDQSDPHDDTNYITEEEWQAMLDRQERLIEKYEESQEEEEDSGLDVGLPNFFGDSTGGMLGLGVIGVVVLAVIGIVTDAIPGLGN